MKRSKMISHIENCLYNNHPIGLSDTEEIAEEILTMMEYYRILPPAYIKLDPSQDVVASLTHEWEKE